MHVVLKSRSRGTRAFKKERKPQKVEGEGRCCLALKDLHSILQQPNERGS